MEFNNFQEYALAKQIEPSLMEEMEKLCPADKKTMENLCLQLKPSVNNLREFNQLAKEICAREKINLEELFNQDNFNRIFDASTGLSPKDKLKKFKQLLEARRFPETEIIKNKINQDLKEITKKHNFKLSPPQELEGDCFNLNISFNSPEQLKTLAAKLDTLSEDKKLREIFSLLKGEL